MRALFGFGKAGLTHIVEECGRNHKYQPHGISMP